MWLYNSIFYYLKKKWLFLFHFRNKKNGGPTEIRTRIFGFKDRRTKPLYYRTNIFINTFNYSILLYISSKNAKNTF